MDDRLFLAVYNLNRSMQELELHSLQIDEAVESLLDLKKTIGINVSVAKDNIETLYELIKNGNTNKQQIREM